MVFIFLLALLIFGPKKLPEIGRQIGKFMAEFKRASNQFKSQLEDEMRQIEIAEALKREKENLSQVMQAANDPAKALMNSIMPPEGSVASGSLQPPVAPAESTTAPEAQPAANSPDYPHLYPEGQRTESTVITAPDAKSSDTGQGTNA